MSKYDQQIFVVEKEILFGNDFFVGFRLHREVDYESRIITNLKSMRRGDAEEDPSHKQPISYILIVNPNSKTVFAYQRSSEDEKYAEKRLQGKWSWGVGGHIEARDIVDNPIRESMLREIKEEVEFKGKILDEPEVLGYIYHDHGVHKVHFGILYLLKTNGEVVPKDPEIAHGRLRTLNELEKICASPNCEVEGWSKTALIPLIKYLQ